MGADNAFIVRVEVCVRFLQWKLGNDYGLSVNAGTTTHVYVLGF